MLLVKTKIGQSKIHGIGCFADEFISKGTMVWRFEPTLDLLLSKEQVDVFSEASRQQFYNYAYLDKKYGKYLLCGDDARFFNHSDEYNCDESVSDITTAIKDIVIGEEILVSYKDFYGNITDHKEIQ